jgi:hypothetical protein
VQEAAEQLRVAAPRQDHRDVRARILDLALCQVSRRLDEPAVRAVDEVERHPAVGAHPLFPQLLRPYAVNDEVHRADLGRSQRPRVTERGQRGQVKAVHEDEDHPPRVVRRGRRLHPGDCLKHLGLGPVLRVQPDQRGNEDHEQHEHDPGALGELHHGKDHDDDQRQGAGREVDDELGPPALLAARVVVLGHAEAGHRERGENADGVQRHQAVDVRVLDDQQRDRGDRQQDDRVGENQPVPALEQPAGQERVARDVAGQEREAVEARVAAGVEDEHGGQLHQVEQRLPGERVAEDHLGFLGEHRRVPDHVRGGMRRVRQPADARDKHAEDDALGDQHLAGVPALRRVERPHRVADRLDAGQRRAAVGERAQQREDHHAADEPLGTGAEGVGAVHRGRVVQGQLAEGLADQADHDHQDHRPGEQVSRYGERLARLLDAAQVAVAHQQHHADADLQLVRADGGDGGRHGGGARRDLDRDRDHVVDQQRHRADLGDARAEVLPGDHVGAAWLDVDHDDLAVREHHERHHQQDDQGQRQDQRERRYAG